MLPAFAAERRAQILTDTCCRCRQSAANPRAAVAAVDRWDRQTDGRTMGGRTPDRYIDPAPFIMRAAAKQNYDHGLRGSASPVLTATGFVNGRWQFSTPTESTPLDRSPKKLLLVIMSATPTAVPNLVQIRAREASGQMGKI